MSASPKSAPGVSSLNRYQQGKASLSGVPDPIKLSSNESRRGPSPKAVDAYQAEAQKLHLYPDGRQMDLRRAIAETHGLQEDLIVCGNGSDEIIQLLIRAYTQPGDEVVVSQYSFEMARIHSIAQGAKVVEAAEPELHPDVDRIIEAISDKTRMVVIASPNNPVGQYLPKDSLRELHRRMPSHAILLVDAAYGDYVEAKDYDAGASLVERYDNVAMTRTFSKLYGLAGLRIGWGYLSEPLIDSVQRIRTPFNANRAALAAAAAAVRDRDFTRSIRKENRFELDRLCQASRDLGIDFIESHANFYLLRFSDKDKGVEAAAKHLESRGIIPRPVQAGGPEGCLRITIGTPSDNDAVIDALRAFVD